MRFNLTATMGLLTPNQKMFAKQLSQIVIDEDQSDSEPGRFEDHEESNLNHAFLLKAVKKMVRSKDKADKRFIDLYKTS